MNHDQQGNKETVSARRRLVRGAFATPTVLALHSGGALAAASSALRCVVNQNLAPITSGPSIVVDTVNLTYVRVQLRKELTVASYWVFGGDLPANRSAPPTLPSATAYQAFNIVTNTLAAAPAVPLAVPNLVANYAVLRVDATGKVVGVGAGVGGSAIGKSCWTSFTL